MLIALIKFSVYLCRIKRKKRFEVTIVVLMLLKSMILLVPILGPVVHFLYATQYIKTCIVVPSLVKKARLILERHQTSIKEGLEEIGSVNELLRIHNTIDQDIKDQNARYKRINAVFLVVDTIGPVLIVICILLANYRIGFPYLFLSCSCFNAAFTLALVVCAFYLAIFLRKSTG